jgi:hypothetical protein
MSTENPYPNLRAVERIADLDGNPLPRPVLKGLFTPETARDYVARHHGPYKAEAFRIAELVQDPRYGRWVAPGDLEPTSRPQITQAEPEA